MSFIWASNYPDLQLVCKTYGLYELDEPDRFCYRVITGITQQGPQCGIVALAMCTSTPNKDKIMEIFAHAKKEGMTNLGEIFSVDYMISLAEQYIPHNTVELYMGSLCHPAIIDFLMSGGTLLVPYDCDKNHKPIKKNGLKAHWAIVFGIVECSKGIFVLARQGKSLNVHIWDIRDLAESNQQLRNYENEKIEIGYKYVIPKGGVGGLNGLCNRSVMIYESDKNFPNLFKSDKKL